MKLRINNEITSKLVRLIDANGVNQGVTERGIALNLAVESGYDLVEIVPDANPPVCKIASYSKILYEEKLRKKAGIKSSKLGSSTVKNLKIRPNIGDHDLFVKINQTQEFIKRGNLVRISVILKGREISRPEVAFTMAQRVLISLDSIEIVSAPKLNGKEVTFTLKKQSN
jgi:translation initiation factor IF-3